MPLFGKDKTETTSPPPASTRTPTSSKPGIFGRRRSSTPEALPAKSSNHGGLSGLLHRDKEDPSITQARQRVSDAEEAERQADRALAQAKVAVREAREHVKRLEAEAAEEYVHHCYIAVRLGCELLLTE